MRGREGVGVGERVGAEGRVCEAVGEREWMRREGCVRLWEERKIEKNMKTY